MQNLHRHSCFSNIFTPDSAATNEDYAKRAVELGHKVLSSVEHGWQGYYFQTYELAHKYGLKCVIGAEAYWVKDRFSEDRSNHHILILCKNNRGREAMNDILSEANITGYYYKPRVDIELLLSLPAEDIVITTACIAFNGDQDVEETIERLHKHFKNNFYLEVQYHNTEKQKEWNLYLLSLSKKYGIQLIVGLDSHYISEKDIDQREYILSAKDLHYEDEENWYMDYPDDETVFNRFIEQGILNESEIQEAMNNTDIALEFEDYDDVPIFNKDIKLPTLYPDKTKEEKDKQYSKLITEKFKEYTKDFSPEEYQRYFDGVKMEVQTYKDTGMTDYPLLDYAIVKDAVEHGGLITATGRGSGAGYFTNTLCGFSKVDRFKSAIKLYPERFISKTRILETHSLPDLDMNVGNSEVFEESQKRILGEDHVAPMIAFGTFKKKSAFKLYARSQNMDFDLANTISNQIGEFDEAMKNAEDDEKDSIDIYDFVDQQYWDYLEQSKNYWGIISDKKKAPSAYLLYQGNIRKEIGLIKCKSESTKKEYITCVIDGAIAENYKYLKNDILKVDVVLLIHKVFERIGMEQFDVNTLLDKVKNDSKVWDIYANGYTIGINQVEKEATKRRCMKYKPKNVSELSAFIAAIRPGFKSMYSRFEAREDFSYGIEAFDNLLKTDELPVSFVIFQEQVMTVLNFAGFPMDQCYGIIKAIAKKHPEKVKPLKSQFIDGFKNRLINEEKIDVQNAQKYADEVWEIINNNVNYSFNSSHAYCVACDSLYQAWQKANYPYEFYEVLLQHYADKGNKDKVAALKEEMQKGFGIKEGDYKFGADNRKFTADPKKHCIYPALSSLKNMSLKTAEDLYSVSQQKPSTFIDLLELLKSTSVNSRQLDILIRLGFFSKFGNSSKLQKIVQMFDVLYDKKQLKFAKCEELGIPEYLVRKHSQKCTEKIAKGFIWKDLLSEWITITKFEKGSLIDRVRSEHEYLGYVQTKLNKLKSQFYYVMDIAGDSSLMLTLYQLKTGETIKIKCRKKVWSKNPLKVGKVINALDIHDEQKWGKDPDGNWFRKEETEPILGEYVIMEV